MAQRPSSIIQRAATVEEVANLDVYLAFPLSSETTGAALRVDGGVVENHRVRTAAGFQDAKAVRRSAPSQLVEAR